MPSRQSIALIAEVGARQLGADGSRASLFWGKDGDLPESALSLGCFFLSIQ